MTYRRPKSVLTDFRPPAAGGKPPLERTARPGAAAWSQAPVDREREAHDKMVVTLSDATLLAAARDLGSRRAFNQRDPESRWITGRLGALARQIDRRGLNRTPA